MKYKEIEKLSKKDREKKLKGLKLELVKSKVSATKAGTAKVKMIKRIIARMNMFNKLENKSGELNNK